MPDYASDALSIVDSEMPSPLPDDLLRLYALIVLVKGVNADLENVHDAWAIWRQSTDANHRSLIPFDQLTQQVQELDRPYMEAIHRAAARIYHPTLAPKAVPESTDEPAKPKHVGGRANAEDCPACRPEIDKTVLHPWICPGEPESNEDAPTETSAWQNAQDWHEVAEARGAALDQLRAYARWCNDHSVEPEARDIRELADGTHRDDYVALTTPDAPEGEED